MKRRKFLKIGGIVTAAAAVPPVAVNVESFVGYAIQSIIKRELSFLKIDPKGLNKFTEIYIKQLETFPPLVEQKYRMNIASVYFLKRNVKNSKTVEGMIESFLLSSNFFLNRMDESKTVTFVGVHDLNKACSNPFSHIYYPPKE